MAAAPSGGPPTGELDMSTQEVAITTTWVIMAVLSTITVGLRFYTRQFILGVFGYEDWLIGAAYVS
jgi:hypothetical protein